MMVVMRWLEHLRYDPIAPLRAARHPAVEYWTRCLMGEDAGTPDGALWGLPTPLRILRHQLPDGSWKYPGPRPRPQTDYNLLETYRELGFLVEMFGLTREHPALAAAAEHVLSHQSAEGDLRGIYGSQYSPNYTAGFLEHLVKAGFADDPRIERAFGWLDVSRQDDGGWALPLRTRGRKLDAIADAVTIRPDTTRPSSHLITGVVLRAYAASPRWRGSPSAREAAAVLEGRLFEPDAYPDKGRVGDWTEFCFPFWMTDLLSALDSISLIDPGASHPKVLLARDWLVRHQDPTGLFAVHMLRDRFHDLHLWVSLAVCRVFARMET